MSPTNKLRWLKVQHKDRPYADMTLQQWWEGFDSNTAINYAHPDAYKLSRNPPGEWRDVEVVNEQT